MKRLSFFFSVLLFLGVFSLGQRVVFAAGETYTWVNPSSIRISGGDITGGPVTLQLITLNPDLLPPGSQEITTGTFSATHRTGCVLSFSFQLINDTTGDFTNSVSSAGGTACSASINSGYLSSNVTIAGQRNGGTSGTPAETTAQRSVSFRYNYPANFDEAPNTVNVVVTLATGRTFSQSLTLSKREGVIPNGSNTAQAYYSGNSITLNAGSYRVCDTASQVCTTFTKVAFQPLQVTWGVSASQLLITLPITYDIQGLPSDFSDGIISPVTFTATNTESGTVYTTQSDPIDLSAGGFADDGSLPTANSRLVNINAIIDVLPSGTYNICVQSYDVCEPYTKPSGPSRFTFNTVDANSDTTGIGDLVDGGSEVAEVVVEPSCESENTSGFEFIFCGLISLADKTMSQLQKQIDSVLDIRPDEYDDQGYRDAWAIIARISTALLVVIALIMIFSTALSFGPFDAYTIRKILPKLVIAVIFMQLSWFLCTTFIQLINEVGRGVEAILIAPFADGRSSITDLGDILFALNDNSNGQSLFSLAALGAAGGGVVAAGGAVLGIFTLLIFVLGAAVSMIIGFFVLLIRKIIIIAMLMFAPIAILCWILPNTDRVYKLWWGTFSKLLYMYPIIISFLTIGKIFAWTAANSESGDAATFIDQALSSVSTFALVIIGYFAPFFLIPMTYKFAGGIFNQLTGMVNNKSKGLVDSPRKWLGDRKNTRKQEKIGESASRLADARRRGEAGGFRDRFRAAQFDPTLSAAGKRRKRASFIATGMAEDRKATEEIFQDAAFSTWSNSDQEAAFAAIASGKDRFTNSKGYVIDLSSLTIGQHRQAQKQALDNLARTQKWQVLRDIKDDVDEGIWNEMTQDHYPTLKGKAGDLIGQDPNGYGAPDLAGQHSSTLATWIKDGHSRDPKVRAAVKTAMLDERIWNSLSYETQIRMMELGGVEIDGVGVKATTKNGQPDGSFADGSHNAEKIAQHVASLRAEAAGTKEGGEGASTGGGGTTTTSTPATSGSSTTTTTPSTTTTATPTIVPPSSTGSSMPHAAIPAPAPGATPFAAPTGSPVPGPVPGTIINNTTNNSTTNNTSTSNSTNSTNNTTTPHDTSDMPRGATGGRQFGQTEGGLIIPRGDDERPTPPTNFGPPPTPPSGD